MTELDVTHSHDQAHHSKNDLKHKTETRKQNMNNQILQQFRQKDNTQNLLDDHFHTPPSQIRIKFHTARQPQMPKFPLQKSLKPEIPNTYTKNFTSSLTVHTKQSQERKQTHLRK